MPFTFINMEFYIFIIIFFSKIVHCGLFFNHVGHVKVRLPLSNVFHNVYSKGTPVVKIIRVISKDYPTLVKEKEPFECK